MTINGWLQIALYCVLLLLITRPIGGYMTRVFTRETDTPPAKFVEEARLDAARQRLEQGTEGLEQVAVATGFGNSLNMRRVFERNLQLTPTEYRERFCSRILA